MPDQRVINRSATRVRTTGRTVKTTPDPEPPAKRKLGRTTVILLVMLVVVVVLGAATAVVFAMRNPGDAAEQATAQSASTEAPTPGAVVEVEPVSVNLKDSHYLRVGFSMQMDAAASSDVSVARAQDIAIDLFSGQTMAGVAEDGARAQLKAQLLERLSQAYEGQVIDVYLTSFITQ